MRTYYVRSISNVYNLRDTITAITLPHASTKKNHGCPIFCRTCSKPHCRPSAITGPASRPAQAAQTRSSAPDCGINHFLAQQQGGNATQRHRPSGMLRRTLRAFGQHARKRPRRIGAHQSTLVIIHSKGQRADSAHAERDGQIRRHLRCKQQHASALPGLACFYAKKPADAGFCHGCWRFTPAGRGIPSPAP